MAVGQSDTPGLGLDALRREALAMPNHPLFYPLHESVRSPHLRDQIQMALAIADATLLKLLLTNSIPPITEPGRIGAVSTQIGVPTREGQAADGVLYFEAIKCVLADAQPSIGVQPEANSWTQTHRELARLTQHESEMRILGQQLALAPMVSLLTDSGFVPKQIEHILRLPQDGWHKSWWYAIDASGQFTLPFLRHIRVRRYPDGTLTVQYKDFFEQTKPPCFTSELEQVLVMFKPEGQGFGDTLRLINDQRQALGITRAILICHTLSELEAQAYINQGISIYPASELVLPMQSNCIHCGRKECLMNGVAESPVALCYGFFPASEFV